MKSPWGESNYRNDNDDRTSSISSHGLLGSLIERSTSAPPLSSEGGLNFGEGGGSVSYLGSKLFVGLCDCSKRIFFSFHTY